MKKLALITVRKGSERLKDKNLLRINNKTILEIAIERALYSNIFDEIWVNSDDLKYQEYCKKYNINHYLRPSHLGLSSTPIDDVIYDFMQHVPSDIIAIVNTPSPLQSPQEVFYIMNKFIDSGADSMMTVEEILGHCFYKNDTLNFSSNVPLERTQDLEYIERCVYAVMAWKTKSFMSSYEENGFGLFCGKNVRIPVSRYSSVLLKTEEDYNIIKSIAEG